MDSEESFIKLETADGVAVVSFNRPRQLNALHNEMMQESLSVMKSLQDNEEVRAIIVRGEGRAFSAGFDLKAAGERKLKGVDAIRTQMELQFDFIMQFWTSKKPTIAAVHGYCIAGAFEASLACDMTVAAQSAIFGEPEVRFGTGAVAMLFPWVTGPKQAKEILLTGEDRLSAAEAQRMGMVNRVVPEEDVMPVARRMARNIARSSAVSVTRTKEAINRSYEIMGMKQALLTGLDIDVEINATDSEEKRTFSRIRDTEGMKAAIAWRDGRFADE
jgi:enoyl-CoA hydratase